ncbi:MAG: hypothetical protein GQ567_06955, partial [Methanosarcinales archaeon]|nr:hypothetical protein [Methanosarcinales archaeon]
MLLVWSNYNSTISAAACRIMRASSEVVCPSPLTSAASSCVPVAASWSAIAASAGVRLPS